MSTSRTVMNRLLPPRTFTTRCSSVTTTARRLQSSSTFSRLEYPLATEAPEVSRTTAKEALASGSATSSTTEVNLEKLQARLLASNEDQDRFDDSNTLTEEQRAQQKKNLSIPPLKGSLPIGPQPPPFIPPNVPAQELEVPQTEITTLENGMRVVSQETYGQVSTIGVVANVGSRQEPQLGVAHLWELVAFGSTEEYDSALTIQELLQDWGGTRFVNSGREQSLACVDILRPNVEKAMHLLRQVLLKPRFLPEEVEDAKRAMEYQALDMPPELVMEEALQTAAFGLDQQLGKPHWCPMTALPHLTADSLNTFWSNHLLGNPQDIVVGGAGIQHDQLVELTQEYFGDWPSNNDGESNNKIIRSYYRGGEHWIEKPSTIDKFTRVALAFEQEGWHSKDLVPACVLQTLLGGGNSFSAGGPGKGMYSRLYRQVLNQFSWAESAEAFTNIHAEGGLWGITASSSPKHSRDCVHVLADHVYRLSSDLVTDEELDRARNMLKCNVLTQLESRLVLFEDLGRQVLTYGTREDMDTTCQKIDAVTKEELRDLVRKSLKKPPTVAAVGEKLADSNIPSQEEVQRWFKEVL